MKKIRKEMPVRYVNTEFRVARIPLQWQSQGLRQTASGYGSKLTTEYMLFITGERPRRIYSVCYSNVASFYVIRNNEKQYLRDADLDAALMKQE